MPSESGITVITPGLEKLFAVEILDRSLRRIDRGYGELRRAVPPGLYVVRCDMGGLLAEQYVKVQEGRYTEVLFEEKDVGRLPSAAPVLGSEACHKYYVYPAADLSNEPRQTIGQGARLVIFASRLGGAPPAERPSDEPVHLTGLQILDENQKLIVVLPGTEVLTAEDVKTGRAAWSIEMQPGGYLLNWPAEDLGPNYRALQPLWLADGWSTLVFANASRNGGLPDRRTVSIQMCRGKFDPYNDPTTTATELALASLRSNRRQLADEHLRQMLRRKLDNPMLGVLGAHMLFERREPDLELLGEVIGNLRRLLGSHPDVTALIMMARRRYKTDFGLESPGEPGPAFPAMLRAGLAMTMNMEWEEKLPARLGPLDSLSRFQLCPEEPWTVFWHAPAFESAMSGQEDHLVTELGDARSPSVRTLGESPGDVLAPVVRPFAESMMTHFDRNIGSFMKPSEKDDAPLPKTLGVFDDRLKSFLKQLSETKGRDALRKLKPEHLRWTGIGPEHAAKVIRQIKAWDN